MAPPTDRTEILSRFRTQIEKYIPIVGAGAGIGLSAKSAEAGGCDLIIIYNSGRFRMAGFGSLAGLMPFSNANDVVVHMAPEILASVKKTPVIAGVCATDPSRNIPRFLTQLRDLGFAGVQNFPTVGLIDEVEMIEAASQMGLLTTPYAFNTNEATLMAKAGADVIVAHMCLTTSGTIGAKTGKTLEECVDAIQAVRDAVIAVNPDAIVLCHGGPIASPSDAEFVLNRVKGIHGFYSASSMERLPVEEAIRSNAQQFKNIKIA